jgi:hypothetical protein
VGDVDTSGGAGSAAGGAGGGGMGMGLGGIDLTLPPEVLAMHAAEALKAGTADLRARRWLRLGQPDGPGMPLAVPPPASAAAAAGLEEVAPVTFPYGGGIGQQLPPQPTRQSRRIQGRGDRDGMPASPMKGGGMTAAAALTIESSSAGSSRAGSALGGADGQHDAQPMAAMGGLAGGVPLHASVAGGVASSASSTPATDGSEEYGASGILLRVRRLRGGERAMMSGMLPGPNSGEQIPPEVIAAILRAAAAAKAAAAEAAGSAPAASAAGGSGADFLPGISAGAVLGSGGSASPSSSPVRRRAQVRPFVAGAATRPGLPTSGSPLADSAGEESEREGSPAAASAAAAVSASPVATYLLPAVECMHIGDVTVPVVPVRPGYVGAYTFEARQRRLARYMAKRAARVWERGVKYDQRQLTANKRLRVRGRFVPKEDADLLTDIMQII